MRQEFVTGESLVLVGGEPRRASPLLHIAFTSSISRSGFTNPLLILAEPVEPTPDATELAAAVVEDVRRALADIQQSEAAARLHAVFALANESVRRYSRRRRADRPLYLGLTCVVACGGDLCTAFVPPGQVLVRQDRELFAFPALESWSGVVSGFDRPGAEPLGARERIEPELLSTRWAPGDLVGVASSSVACWLAPLHADLAAAGSADEMLSLVGERCDRQGVLDGQVGVVAVGARTQRRQSTARSSNRAAQSVRHERAGGSSQPRSTSVAPLVRPPGKQFKNSPPFPLDQPGSTVQTESAHEWGSGSLGSRLPGELGVGLVVPSESWRRATDEFVTVSDPIDVPAHPAPVVQARPIPPEQGSASWMNERAEIRYSGSPDRFVAAAGVGDGTPRAPRQRDAPRAFDLDHGARRRPVGGKTIVELLAGLILSLTAAVVGVWQITRRDRPIEGFRDDTSFGLPHVDVWRKTHKSPRMTRLRAAFPRLEIGRVVLVAIVVLALSLAAFYAYSRIKFERAEQINTFELDFQAVIARHAEARSTSDPATAYAVLIDARRQLDELAASQAPDNADPRLESERAAILSDLDRLANMQRFTSAQPIGAVTHAPQGVTPRLIAGGGRVYVLTDALYQLDSASRDLIRLLGPGDIVAHPSEGETTVGTLRGAAWRDDRIMTVDAQNAYLFDAATGTWTREPLGTFDAEGFVATRSVESYGRNLYMLAPVDGQILKFAAGAYDSQPEDWTAGLAEDDLRQAVDLSIDGHVFVLIADGRVHDFFMSRLEGTLTPNVVPALDTPVAVAAAPDSPFVYVLNGSDGRMVRIARDGSGIQQFMPDRPDLSLAGAQDFVIDEGSGIAFILAHDAIYTVRLPAAPQQPTPSEEATPAP
jgi:hypothetical protein